MPFVANFPLFCIVITLFSGVLSSMLSDKKAFKLNVAVLLFCLALNGSLLAYLVTNPQQITYMMGHFPAPWGNETRFGPVEALIATVFCFVMLVSLIAGKKDIFDDVKRGKVNIFYTMINLLMSSLLALVYTNDMFTAYVFVEINTLAACAVVMAKENGKTISATIRYLIMSLLGSGLFLLSLTLVYDLTGHLLMENIHTSLTTLMATGNYQLPVTIIIGLMSVAMAIKSALFPFHTWLSHAHGNATTASSSILSGLVLKGYIILLIKIYYRVLGLELVSGLKVLNILFVFGVLGMIIGSIDAIGERHIKRMIAFSSVAQMGYIYVGISLGTTAGFLAAIFHIIVHAVTKPMLFSAAGGLAGASDHKYHFDQLTGSAYRNPIAGIAFVIGSLSMIGIPFFSGFGAKYYLSMAAMTNPGKMWFTMIALAVSTVLNAMYYIRAIRNIYLKTDDIQPRTIAKSYKIGMGLFIVANVLLGLFYQYVVNIIDLGLKFL